MAKRAPFTPGEPRRYLARASGFPSPHVEYGPILLHMVRLAVRRPGLVVPLLSAAWRFRARDWYRRAPFLPLPPRQYLAWRFHTAYGDEGYLPEAGEVERYLRWVSRMRVRGSRKETSS